MHQMTKEAIKKLLLKTNHVLDVEDFDLIEQLDSIANDLSITTRTQKRILREPFELCGVNFYPLTVAKSLWCSEKIKEWELEADCIEPFTLWMLTLPLTEDCFDGFETLKVVDRAVKKMGRKLHCSDAELLEVYHKCIGRESGDTDESGDAVDYGGMISVLVKEYGGTPAYWLYEESVEFISVLILSYSDRNAQQSKASSPSGKAVAPAPSRQLAALSKFREKANKISDKWSVEDGS